MPTVTTLDVTGAASELRIVLAQLLRRLRAETTLPVPQATVLSRLERDGPSTASELAAHERMRPQSMAYTVAELERAGLVTRSSDPDDGRRRLVALTARGRDALLAERSRREGWIAEAIEQELTPAEQRTLVEAVALLERLVRL